MAVASNASGLAAAFGVFQNRNFRLLWLAQLVTEMGSSVTALASSIYVYQVTGSALNVGLMMIATVAPSLVVGLAAGVFVDRYDRKRIMLITEVVRAVLIASIPLLLPSNVAWLYIMVALSSCVGQFFNPAHASVLPDVATEEELDAANSFMAISQFGALAIGYAAAGLIAARYPIEYAFYLDAATFLVSGALIWLVRVPKNAAAGPGSVSLLFDNLREGLHEITAQPVVRSLFILFLPVFIAYGLGNALRLPFMIQALGAGEFEYGLLEALTIVGFVAASLMMAAYGGRLREGQWIAISFIGVGITSTLFALNSVIWIALAISVVEGFMNAPSVIARTLLIQRNTPREMRGRVFSAFFVGRDVMFMIGMALAGLADYFNVRWLYLLSGLVVLSCGLLALTMPGLGQTTADWRRGLQALRRSRGAPGLAKGRPLQAADYDRLVGLVPGLSMLSNDAETALRSTLSYHEVAEGTAILRRGELSDAAYFLLDGQAVAGLQDGSEYRVLEILQPGNIFGEIAAINGVPRTADVVSDRPSTIVRMPAQTLLSLMSDPTCQAFITTKMHERLERMNTVMASLPGRYDQSALRELSVSEPER